MEKTRKQKSINKILTLMLAFVMVFTGMGIGSWGVSEAWASETYIVNDVIGITADDIAGLGGTPSKPGELPIEGAGKLIGTYNELNLYSIELEERYDGITLKSAIVSYTKDGKGSSFYNYRKYASGNVTLDEKLSDIKVKYSVPADNDVIKKDDVIYANAKNFYESEKGRFTLNNQDDISNSDEYIMFTLFNTTRFGSKAAVSEIKGYVIIKLGNGIQVTAEELDKAIAKAPNIPSDSTYSTYYRESDRWNGKVSISDLITELKANEKIKADPDTTAVLGKYDNLTGKDTTPKSFSALYEATVKRVNAIYPETGGTRVLAEGTTQTQVDAATELLNVAIANLIPKTQLNATALYEAIKERGNYTDEYLENFTATSAARYRKALKEAQDYLASLFDKSKITPENPRGATDENIAKNQNTADGYADKLREAAANLTTQETLSNAKVNKKTIDALAKLYNMTENNGEYTDDSWNAFVTARENAVNHAKNNPISEATTNENLHKYSGLARAFQLAVYGLTPTSESVKITFTYTDDYHLRVPDSSMEDSAGNVPVKGSYTVTKGTKISDFLQQYGYTYSPSMDSSSFEYSHLSRNVLIVNGNRLYGYTPEQQYLSESEYVLKDGDEVQLVHMDWPNYVFNYIYRDEVSWDKMADYLGILRLTGSSSETEAGKAVQLTVERTSAHPWTYTGKYSAYEGATLAAYGPQNDDGTYPETPILSDLVSKEDGTVSIKLYEAGKYIITAYDARENDEDKSLFYSGTVAAPYFEVTVAEAEDSSAVKKELKTALDKVYKAYKEEYFRPENWTTIQNAYDKANAVLNSKESIVAEAYSAQQTAINTIKGIQDKTTAENTNNLATFRKHLNRLPDDITLITKSVESTVTALINTYEGTESTKGMSDYQKTQLTGVEQAKYDSIKALLETGELPAEKSYSLTFNVEADTPEATEQIRKVMQYLHDNPARMDSVSGVPSDGAYTQTPYDFNVKDSKANPLSGIRFYGDLTYNAYFHNDKSKRNQAGDPKNTLTIDIPDTNCTITDENISFIKNGKSLGYDVNGSLTLNVDGTTYELKSITYEGLEESDVAYGTLSCLDFSGYKGKNDQWVNIYFNKAYLGFTMPYNDVTITLNWGPVTSADELQAAKDNAKSVLGAAFSDYEKEKGKYSPKNWTILETAYNDGISSIEAPETDTLDKVAAARKAALAAMAKVTKEGSTAPSTESVGTVYVTVENTTFTKSKWEGTDYWEGQLVNNEPIEITKDSTMMSCVVEALKKVGATQKGAESNYISEINGLAEFDGGPNSGWMGTLNDWFTNLGFGSFTVANGGLGDGDEIRIMYTTNGLGEDLGGSWANSNTTLKDLAVSGGTLTPSFTSGNSGNTYEYTLLITGKTANVKITPTAANKNFLTKIFLNEKVTNNTQGTSFYKRTQTIPVTAGDTIYVGCGERQWASMNNQEGNVQANGGTWYVLKVVSGDNAKEYVEKAIKALPEADKVKLSNYKSVEASVKEIDSLLEALTSTEPDETSQTKLKEVKEKVKFYTEIDDAKTKLNALTDSSSSSQAREALSAYNKLTDEQKKYITQADVKKFNELAEKYSLSGITGAEEMPESEVETTGKSGSAITTSPAEVKMSGTTAAITIKADNQKEILKQAKEKKSAQVVLTVAEADAKGAEKYELSLEKTFLQSLLKDTTAKLVVKTPMGQKTYDREALQKLVDEATTAVIKAEINKDNLDQQTEEPEVDAKALTAKLTPVARSAKTAKKNVKVTVSLDKQDKEILSQLKEAGYTVKYRFYRSTKKSAGYKSTVTKKTATYTNTSGKKGTKYFYKVQVRVYDENGKLVAKTALKQCKYASRTWSR